MNVITIPGTGCGMYRQHAEPDKQAIGGPAPDTEVELVGKPLGTGELMKQWLKNMKGIAKVALCTCLLIYSPGATASSPVVDGITFSTDPGQTYVPLGEVAGILRKQGLGGQRLLTDGTVLVSLASLAEAGVSVTPNRTGKGARVGRWLRSFDVVVGKKTVEIDLSEQRLRAWQGNRLVLECRISSGRDGRTPVGEFRAGPYKARRHYSSLYENAPMPWSVQVTGHVFIHGFTSVPDYPASHGCIRLPIDGGNPARFFYEWVDRATPIQIKK